MQYHVLQNKYTQRLLGIQNRENDLKYDITIYFICKISILLASNYFGTFHLYIHIQKSHL